MNSLRVRLLTAMLVTIVGFGSAWYFARAWDMRQPETGYWDSRLRGIGRLIVSSMPRTLTADEGAAPAYHLADTDIEPIDDMAFQVWNLQTRKLMMRSPSAPDTPMRPDFSPGFDESHFAGQAWRVYTVADNTGSVQVQVAKSQQELDETYQTWRQIGILATMGVFLLLAIVVWAGIRLSLRPLDRIRDTVAGRAPLDPAPLPETGLPSEIRPFVRAINHLLERQEAALARERRLIADAAHELRTPLAAIQAQAQVVQTQLAATAEDTAHSRAAATKLQAVAVRAARLVEQLLDQARLESDDAWPMEALDLADLADLIARDFEGPAERKRQKITLDARPCPLRGNIDTLGILLSNLLDNAVRYTPALGHITVACRLDDGTPCLEVADDGPGVAEPDRARIFERFFRVAGSGERGAGLGLSLVARIAAMHGAVLEDRPASRGFHLVVRFPTLDADPIAIAATPAPPMPRRPT
ncbi:ATP-binding protein [Bordetella sp. LUAb4]|uniref:ATP-binding protein n=1 Tax=Bordetella sp. LUAb4 TaxID=2843195 RepID=UPI001E3B255A|nr:ATP-binding protein [Bordetella sp. LUAb4]